MSNGDLLAALHPGNAGKDRHGERGYVHAAVYRAECVASKRRIERRARGNRGQPCSRREREASALHALGGTEEPQGDRGEAEVIKEVDRQVDVGQRARSAF